jgi:SAM-dependent methyltransferase
MNDEKWKEYIRYNEIEETQPAMSLDIRSNDIDFVSKWVNFKDKKVLDIGCEDGKILNLLKERFNSDISGITLGKITRGNEIFKGDMHEIPFENKLFDVVLILHTLEHSIAPYIALSEIKRVLKTDGIVVIISPEEGDIWTCIKQHYFTPTFRQLANLLNKLGFIPISNFRKEYCINIKEWKRDIIAIWQNTEYEPQSLVEDRMFPIPVLGLPITNDWSLRITPVIIEFRSEKNDGIFNQTHLSGRTDSLMRT